MSKSGAGVPVEIQLERILSKLRRLRKISRGWRLVRTPWRGRFRASPEEDERSLARISAWAESRRKS
jgi:hypothetical protein